MTAMVEPASLGTGDRSLAIFEVVELELLKRGWIVGNFNHTVLNSAGWDLFATRGDRSVRLRVKAKRPSIDCFRWSAKADGSVFLLRTASRTTQSTDFDISLVGRDSCRQKPGFARVSGKSSTHRASRDALAVTGKGMVRFQAAPAAPGGGREATSARGVVPDG